MIENLHEHNINYVTKDGHTHDGLNSTAVVPAAKSLHMNMLGSDIISWILSLVGQDETAPTSEVGPVDDLTIDVGTVAVDDTTIGEVVWSNMCLVRYINITATPDSTCDITFYHTDSYDNQDREFVAQNCIDEFLWEGTWVHKDDTDQSKLFWSLKNTGSVDSIFTITLKACGVG